MRKFYYKPGLIYGLKLNKLGTSYCIKVKTKRCRDEVLRKKKKDSEWAIFMKKKRKKKGTGQWKKDREEKKGNLNTDEHSI